MVEVNPVLSQYSREDQLNMLATLMGFKHIPVDIETFMNDEYYLGLSCGTNPLTGKSSVFDIWHQALNRIYPDGIRTSTFVANGGAIGTGKSTMAKIALAYDIYKLTMMKDPGASFNLIKKFFHFVIFNLTKENAERMVIELKDMLSKSLYFQEQMQDSESVMQWVAIDPASRMSDIISNDVVSIVFSEMNFVRDPSLGIKLIDQGISRVTSRFQKGIGILNHIILDSSDTSVEAPVPYFLSHHVRGPETIVFKYAIWEAKPSFYFHEIDPETGKNTFTVYRGDSETLPCIVTRETDTNGMDPDRFLEVPLELKKDFEADIELALNEKAGVAVETTSQYFRGDKVVQAMVYDMKIPEIISIDFAGPESFIPYFESLVDSLPDDRCLFGGLDLGISGDKAGFALGYIENLNMRDNDGVISYDPHVVVPCCVSFDRPPGQETNIDKIVDLIFWIHSRRPFFRFVMDTYQSFPIKQKLIVGGINADFISVDKKTIYYKTAKQMIYAGKAKLPKSTLLKNELINLIDLGTKIDHHHVKNAAGDIGSDSKDAADALTRLLVAMHDATEEAMDPPIISNTARKKYNDELVRQWVEGEAKMKYQIMFGNQFGLPVDFKNPFD